MSCYDVGSSLALAHVRHATLWDLLLHLHTYVMLRCGIFSCTCTRTSCYAVGSSLALAHIRHATLWDLLLHLHTALCLVFSNFDLNLLISTAALELQLSKRCPTWPHPRHVRGIRSSTLSMLHSCKQSKACST